MKMGGRVTQERGGGVDVEVICLFVDRIVIVMRLREQR